MELGMLWPPWWLSLLKMHCISLLFSNVPGLQKKYHNNSLPTQHNAYFQNLHRISRREHPACSSRKIKQHRVTCREMSLTLMNCLVIYRELLSVSLNWIVTYKKKKKTAINFIIMPSNLHTKNKIHKKDRFYHIVLYVYGQSKNINKTNHNFITSLDYNVDFPSFSLQILQDLWKTDIRENQEMYTQKNCSA